MNNDLRKITIKNSAFVSIFLITRIMNGMEIEIMDIVNINKLEEIMAMAKLFNRSEEEIIAAEALLALSRGGIAKNTNGKEINNDDDNDSASIASKSEFIARNLSRRYCDYNTARDAYDVLYSYFSNFKNDYPNEQIQESLCNAIDMLTKRRASIKKHSLVYSKDLVLFENYISTIEQLIVKKIPITLDANYYIKYILAMCYYNKFYLQTMKLRLMIKNNNVIPSAEFVVRYYDVYHTTKNSLDSLNLFQNHFNEHKRHRISTIKKCFYEAANKGFGIINLQTKSNKV